MAFKRCRTARNTGPRGSHSSPTHSVGKKDVTVHQRARTHMRPVYGDQPCPHWLSEHEQSAFRPGSAERFCVHGCGAIRSRRARKVQAGARSGRADWPHRPAGPISVQLLRGGGCRPGIGAHIDRDTACFHWSRRCLIPLDNLVGALAVAGDPGVADARRPGVDCVYGLIFLHVVACRKRQPITMIEIICAATEKQDDRCGGRQFEQPSSNLLL